MKKKIIVLLAILGIIVLIAGCSSSGSTPPADQAQGQPSTTGTTPTGATAGTAVPQAQEKKEVPRDFSFKKGDIPYPVEKAIKDGKPVVIGVFLSNDKTSEQVEVKVQKIMDEYPNTAYFPFIYDDTDNEIARLTLALGVGYLPYVGIVDNDSKVVFEKNGYIDSAFLSQAVASLEGRDTAASGR